MNKFIFLILSIVLACAEEHTQAQPADNKTMAQQLFKQARDLMEDAQYAAACPLLEASNELDPATGTLFNLARCYENVGKLASAWRSYRAVANQDRDREEHVSRMEYAHMRAVELQPQIPRLTVNVPEESHVPGLRIERNGQVIAEALYGVPAYVDLEEHRLVATAPGRRSFTVKVKALEGRVVKVTIPKLKSGAGLVDDNGRERPGKFSFLASARRNPRRFIGLAAGGAGLLTMTASLLVGSSARSLWSDAFESGLCTSETMVCTPTGQSLSDKAHSRANVATLLFGAGSALVVTGAVLYLLQPKLESRSGALTFAPFASPGSAGITVSRAF